MANSKAFILFYIVLLSSHHVLTHELHEGLHPDAAHLDSQPSYYWLVVKSGRQMDSIGHLHYYASLPLDDQSFPPFETPPDPIIPSFPNLPPSPFDPPFFDPPPPFDPSLFAPPRFDPPPLYPPFELTYEITLKLRKCKDGTKTLKKRNYVDGTRTLKKRKDKDETIKLKKRFMRTESEHGRKRIIRMELKH